MSIYHANVRSVSRRFLQLKSLVLEVDCLCFAVSETWLSADLPDSLFGIPGYTLLRSDRPDRGGGVALYLRKF